MDKIPITPAELVTQKPFEEELETVAEVPITLVLPRPAKLVPSMALPEILTTQIFSDGSQVAFNQGIFVFTKPPYKMRPLSICRPERLFNPESKWSGSGM